MDDTMWREMDFSFADACGQNKISMVPSTFLHPSRHSAIPQSSNIAEAILERQVSDVTVDPNLKKRQTDRAYRQRCKEHKEITKRRLDMLIEENDRLKVENDFFKKEEVRLKLCCKSQDKEIKRLKKDFCQLNGELSRQNTVVEVLSNRLAGCKDNNLLQSENARLKYQIDLLKKKINNPENLNTIQLQGRVAELEHENKARQLIIDALCDKINNDKTMNRNNNVKEHAHQEESSC